MTLFKIAYPRFEALLTEKKVFYALNETKKELVIVGAGKIIFRTMDAPKRSSVMNTPARRC